MQQLIPFIFPGFLTFMLVLFSASYFPIDGIAYFVPMFDIMAIYYWSIYRPQVMPSWFVFLLGLVQDALYGTPFGMTSLTGLVLQYVAISQRKLFLEEGFTIVWLGFIILSFVMSMLRWVLSSFYLNETLSMHTSFIQWLITCTIYSFMHLLFNRLYYLLPKHDIIAK